MVGKAGSMLLCVGNLPARVTRKDLKTFVQDVIDGLDRRSLRFGSSITECTILRLTDPVTGSTNYHGLIGIQPPRLGLRLIDRLQSVPMRGNVLSVRRYRHASFLNTDAASATMSDLLGTVAGADDTDSRVPACRIELVQATGGAESRVVNMGARAQSGAFAH